MNIVEFFLAFLLLIVLPYIGLWKLFEKAGLPGWYGIIPIWNFYQRIKLSGRPVWWLILYLIPGIGILFALGVQVDLVKSYGKFSFRENAAGVFLPFIYLVKW